MARATKRVTKGLESVPLTWRLVTILLTLLLATLTLTAGATTYLLYRDLIQSTDEQLRAVAEPVATARATAMVSADAYPSNYAVHFQNVVTGSTHTLSPVWEPSRPALPALGLDDPRVTSGQPFTVDSQDGSMTWRFVAGKSSDNLQTFAVGVPLREVNETVRRSAILATILTAFAMVGSGVLGYFATRRAVRPLRRIEDVAAAIAAGDLSQRVPVRTSHDEVASLSDSLNVMLSQIEHSFSMQEASEMRMRQFVADASHELRTPLATVRGYAELYRQGAVTRPEDVSTSMSRIEGEATRMSALVEDLLLLARLDDERPLEKSDVDLVVISAEAAHDARARSPQRTVTVHGLAGELAPVNVWGDDHRLRQVLGNLIGNALMHTEDSVPVEVMVGSQAGLAVVEIRDHGSGIDDQAAARIFERFYREDKARSRARGGSGLGLAIVAAIVDQHGGTVRVGKTPGGGATFRVELPTATPQPTPSPS